MTVTDATGQTASDTLPPIPVDPAPIAEGEPTTTNDTAAETAAPSTTGGETTPAPPRTTIDTGGQ